MTVQSTLPPEPTTTTTTLALALANTTTNPSIFGKYFNTSPPIPLPQTTDYYTPILHQDDNVSLDSSSLMIPSNHHPTGKFTIPILISL